MDKLIFLKCEMYEVCSAYSLELRAIENIARGKGPKVVICGIEL